MPAWCQHGKQDHPTERVLYRFATESKQNNAERPVDVYHHCPLFGFVLILFVFDDRGEHRCTSSRTSAPKKGRASLSPAHTHTHTHTHSHTHTLTHSHTHTLYRASSDAASISPSGDMLLRMRLVAACALLARLPHPASSSSAPRCPTSASVGVADYSYFDLLGIWCKSCSSPTPLTMPLPPVQPRMKRLDMYERSPENDLAHP